jgi:hypothetical protein
MPLLLWQDQENGVEEIIFFKKLVIKEREGFKLLLVGVFFAGHVCPCAD